MSARRLLTSLVTLGAAFALHAAPANAAHHLMDVMEIATSANGSTAQQFVEVEDQINEAFPSPPYKLVAYEASGSLRAQHVFDHPGTVGPGVDESNPILVATTAWDGAHPEAATETLPDNFLPTGAGQVCFSQGATDANKIDCVAYGCVASPISPTTAAPAPADGLSAQRQGFDGAFQVAAPTPKAANNAGTSPPACPPTPPPAPEFVTGPNPGETITDDTADFYWLEAEPAGSFQCSADGAAFSACLLPFPFGSLTNTAHSFEVRQLDSALTEGDTAARNFTVDTGGTPADVTIGDDVFTPDGSSQAGATRKPLGSEFSWKWAADGGGTVHFHNVRQDKGLFSSGDDVQSSPPFETTPSAGTYGYYCTVHGSIGMDGDVEVIPVRDLSEPGGLPFRVAWDNGTTSTTASTFDVRYSVNDGPFKTWLDDTRKPAGTFGKKNRPVKVKADALYEFQVRSQKGKKRSGFSPGLPVRP